MICFPNAKINIGLNIVSKRPDGYHNLETLFYPIDVCDALEIIDGPEIKETRLYNYGVKLESSSEDNLVMKAYRKVNERFALPPLEIHLRKNIPFGAGLGGGSADAAFMIRLLNDKFELGMCIEDMEQIASGIGADVPFFIANKPVYATGIGDEFEEIDFSLKGYFLVLIKPDVSVSTPEAYSMVKPQEPVENIRDIVKKPIGEWKDVLVNDFELSVFTKKPVIGEIKERLYEAGALYASMSGSGSSVFGIFESEISVEGLKEEFAAFGVCIPLN